MNTSKLVARFSQKIANLCKVQNTENYESKAGGSTLPQSFVNQLNSQQLPMGQVSAKQTRNSKKTVEVDLLSEDNNNNNQQNKSSIQLPRQQEEYQVDQQQLYYKDRMSDDQNDQEQNHDDDKQIEIENEHEHENENENVEMFQMQQYGEMQYPNAGDGDLLNIIKKKIQKDARDYDGRYNGYSSRDEYDDKNGRRTPQQNNNNNNSSNNANNNGFSSEKQLDQASKRKFIKKLMRQIANQNPIKVNEILKNAAHKIEVHLYQVKIWLTAYKLIFTIEKVIEKKGGNPNPTQKMSIIKKQLLQYLLRNKNEKRYRIIKILNIIFSSFNINEIRTHAWVNQFLNQHSKQLQGIQIFVNHTIKKQKGDQSDDAEEKQIMKQFSRRAEMNKTHRIRGRYSSDSGQNSESDPDNPSARKKKIVKNTTAQIHKFLTQKNETVKERRKYGGDPFSEPQYEDISMYPPLFKKKLSDKINDQIFDAIDQIFVAKGQEFCLSYNSIKCIYLQNGMFSLRRKSNQLTNGIKLGLRDDHLKNKLYSKQGVLRSSNDPQVTKISNLVPIKNSQQNNDLSQSGQFAKLEARLLAFIKNNINCPISTLQRQTENNMQNLSFPEKWKADVRNQWFCLFLRKNKLSVSSDRRVVRVNPPPQQNQQAAPGQNSGQPLVQQPRLQNMPNTPR